MKIKSGVAAVSDVRRQDEGHGPRQSCRRHQMAAAGLGLGDIGDSLAVDFQRLDRPQRSQEQPGLAFRFR
jgi:hypothetical protein